MTSTEFKQIRIRLSLSQEQLARKLGLSVARIQQLEAAPTETIAAKMRSLANETDPAESH